MQRLNVYRIEREFADSQRRSIERRTQSSQHLIPRNPSALEILSVVASLLTIVIILAWLKALLG